ncbi:hypothetical protein E1176_10550 [Fulvivirga sp. RKSG066]|uniref:hypothetical protein n=1 Tax=Fulvivirga aurantia TaxID=2529383 RepID=UPI0012BC9DF5|nr:hypothetical protein [Fulvivirga aurantia]MTI21457.1 hypothetical protein [Fulvivirga aurantia]
MKYILQSLFVTLLLIVAASCSEEKLVNEIIDGVETGAVIRNLGEVNALDSADLSSTYTIELEVQDGAEGSLLQEVRVNVGFADQDDIGTDTVAISTFETISAAEFNETSANGLPKATFSATLNELANHVGTSAGNFSVDDVFLIDFELVLTDGRVFNLSNATSDVTRTGRFSYFNSQFRYAPVIQDPNRVEIVEFSLGAKSNGRLMAGAQDTVFVTFSDGNLITDPTITRVSAGGNTDDVQGVWTQSTDDEDVYFFVYTAGAANADTVSFSFNGAEIVSGFPSYTQTFKNAFIIDNVITASVADSEVIVQNGQIDKVSLTFDFGEPLAGDSVSYDVSSAQFDDFVVEKPVVAGSQMLILTFTPTIGGSKIPNQILNFDVVITGAKDETGNEASENLSITLLN